MSIRAVFTFEQSRHSNALCPVRPSQTAFGSGGWPRPAVFAAGHPGLPPPTAMHPSPKRGVHAASTCANLTAYKISNVLVNSCAEAG